MEGGKCRKQKAKVYEECSIAPSYSSLCLHGIYNRVKSIYAKQFLDLLENVHLAHQADG